DGHQQYRSDGYGDEYGAAVAQHNKHADRRGIRDRDSHVRGFVDGDCERNRGCDEHTRGYGDRHRDREPKRHGDRYRDREPRRDRNGDDDCRVDGDSNDHGCFERNGNDDWRVDRDGNWHAVVHTDTDDYPRGGDADSDADHDDGGVRQWLPRSRRDL